MAKILVIEDDLELANIVKEWLTLQNYTVEMISDGEDALQMVKSFPFDLLVLDLELPGVSGITILKEYRSAGGGSPVLILTGKNSYEDKEIGLDAGADDYLTKPFDGRELSARIRALLRRPPTYTGDDVKAGDLVLNRAKHELKRGNESINLLPREFDLLEFLMRHPNRVYSAEALLESVWNSESESSLDAVTSCIKRLRKKIDVPGADSIIRSVYGVGYELRCP